MFFQKSDPAGYMNRKIDFARPNNEIIMKKKRKKKKLFIIIKISI